MLLHSKISTYADDTVIYFSGPGSNEIRRTLKQDLIIVDKWISTSKLVLYKSKTKGMLFGSKHKLDFTIQIQNNTIERFTNFSFLGVMLDDQLKWNDHITLVFKCLNDLVPTYSRVNVRKNQRDYAFRGQS